MNYGESSRQKAKQLLAQLETAKKTLHTFFSQVQDMKDYTLVSKETFDVLLNGFVRPVTSIGVNWPEDFNASLEIKETAKELNSKWWGNENEFRGPKTHIFNVLFGDASSISDIPQGKLRVKRMKSEFDDFYHLAKTVCAEVLAQHEFYN